MHHDIQKLFLPLKRCTAKEIAHALIPVFSRIGIPEEILSSSEYQGRQFTANYMQELMDIMDIKHLVTSPYHPICIGLVESFNGTLKQMLYKLCKEQPYEWNKLIDPLLFSYRELPNETTGSSPCELIYGRNVRRPMQILHELWTKDEEQ